MIFLWRLLTLREEIRKKKALFSPRKNEDERKFCTMSPHLRP
jgi:hypothetical protein